jgi:curli production assembly/transport component CsgG
MKKQLITYYGLLIAASLLMTSCTGVMKPLHTERATAGLISESSTALKSLPEPEEKVVAAVYRFRDQTGQYKPSDRVASWSTAVTQGATSILMKAMEDSGWFVTIERESVSNLLNERQIIQNIRQQNAGPGGPTQLPPLLFAGVVLEGGIIGYDTNVVTGGAGARYLGTGASSQYRKDQVTIYLRAVSTQSGRVLKTVHTTKSIISQQLESGIFRFIDTNRLLESEAGYTYNEPPVMAVTEAIDEALKELILEGIDDGVWSPKNPEEVEEYRLAFNAEKFKQEQLARNYFGLIEKPNLREGWTLNAFGSMGSVIGNYSNPDVNPGVSMKLERGWSSGFSLKAGGQYTTISAGDAYSDRISAAEVLGNYYLTPKLQLSPYVAAGAGSFFLGNIKKYKPYGVLEGGFDYKLSNEFGVRFGANYRYLFEDGLDGVEMGKYNDQHWGVNIGFTYSPNF